MLGCPFFVAVKETTCLIYDAVQHSIFNCTSFVVSLTIVPKIQKSTHLGIVSLNHPQQLFHLTRPYLDYSSNIQNTFPKILPFY